ncbi:MAG: MFS transporter, partial [Methanospirillaceae archaeon]|nr:MFS transporter [Methanospirillaceae archaeon]
MSGSDPKKILLFVSSLASFLVPYTVSSLNVALPAIGSEFSLDAVTLGWITTAYLVTAAVLILPLGGLADIYGRKRIFLVGNVLFAVGSLLAAVSLSGSGLILSRVVQGLGGSMVFATSVAIVTAVFPPGERGKAIGIITATVYAGLSAGPVIGGVLTQYLGWPSIFLLNVPLALVVIVLTLTEIPGEWKAGDNLRYDRTGAVLYCIMLTVIIYGLLSLPSLSGFFWMLAGLIPVWFFIRWEKKQKVPLLTLSLFTGNRTFLYSNLASLINYAVVFAVG